MSRSRSKFATDDRQASNLGGAGAKERNRLADGPARLVPNDTLGAPRPRIVRTEAVRIHAGPQDAPPPPPMLRGPPA